MAAHHNNPRGVRERIHISGQLVLDTPAHFGNGQVRGDALVDMTLLFDETEAGKALIPGTSIAGALRNYLRERLRGDFEAEDATDASSKIAWLFGPTRESQEDMDQSLLVVDDAMATRQAVTLRDGVRICPQTGIAFVQTLTDAAGQTHTAGAKFDFELLEAGTTFDLHLELSLTAKKGKEVLPSLVAALQGFEQGEIRLGARKRRGFGQCHVSKWTVSRYRLTEPAELCAWLKTPSHDHRVGAMPGKIATALDVQAPAEDHRERLRIDATLAMSQSSLLIRSGFGEAHLGADMIHLHAEDVDGHRRPVVPGTSWAGVLRHRALRIANTIAGPSPEARSRPGQLVDRLFGYMPVGDELPRGSKLTVDDTFVEGGELLYQTRVRIDRFTGGGIEGALFDQAPVYGKSATQVGFHLDVRQPSNAEIGLLLLVLKDLATGDLPVGGEASAGRGRLHATSATVTLPDRSVCVLRSDQPALGASAAQQETLQTYVKALRDDLTGTQEESNE